MIGRTVALERLLGLVEAAEVLAADGPAIALVSGEPGIGKSRLVRELLAAVPTDVSVLTVQAQPGSLGRPFDVLGQLAPGEPAPMEAVRTLVERAARAGRAVLVVEDLHWIDADSAHLLEQFATQPWPHLVIVGTFRPNDLSRRAPGGELVSRFERQYSVDQIRLDRLDRMEVAALLSAITAGAPTSGAVDTVHRRSGGNPFVVEELVRCCGADACTSDLLSAQLPWSIDEAVHQQLAGLEPDQRRAVEALAVFGDPASFDVLRHVSDLDEAMLLDAIRELILSGVLVEPVPDEFWFGHALVADAVHQQIIGRERRRLHERSLHALREQPRPDHAALVRHAVGAGQFDDVVPIAREGARAYLDRGASFQALRVAVDALAEAPDDADLLAVATEAAWRLDFQGEALEYGRRWRAVAGDDLQRVEASRLIARVLHELARQPECDEEIDRLVGLAESLPPGVARGRSFGAVAQLLMLARRNTAAVEWAERALQAAAEHDDRWLAAQAKVERASAMAEIAPPDDAESLLLEAYRAALVVGDRVLACRALNNLLGLLVPHSAQSASLRAELRTLSASAGFDKLGAAMLALREAEAAFGRGDARGFRRAVGEAEQYGSEWMVEHCLLLTKQAVLALEEGRPAAAIELGRQLEQHATDLSERRTVPRIGLLAAAQLGDREMAATMWREVLDTPDLPDGGLALTTAVDVVAAALSTGIPPTDVRAAVTEGPLGTSLFSRDLCALVEGLLLAAEGDHVEAAAALGAVLDDPDPRLSMPTIGLLRVAHAAALLASGDRSGALVAARRAVHDDLASWPGWRRDRAEALVRRLEGSPVRAGGELTAREREVAALIAEGLTNGQLAERLYISPKTAAVHVSNILMKLGLSGRAEVAAWAVRHGVVLQPG
jgi:DNA-binding CsgD family transcriptional regulator